MSDMTLPQHVIDAAIEATHAVGCIKSVRGSAVFGVRSGDVYGVGRNYPVVGTCVGSAACREACNKLCVHAEVAALRNALRVYHVEPELIELDVVHVKVIDGVLVVSGGPSCWQCARDLRADGISGVWLYHESGWRRYPIAEFYELTTVACGMPTDLAMGAGMT